MASASGNDVFNFPVTRRMLFVCEDPEVIADIVPPLRRSGIVVETAEDAHVALDRVSEFRPNAVFAVETRDSICAAEFCKCFALLRSNDLYGGLPSPKLIFVGDTLASLDGCVTEHLSSLPTAKRLVEMSLSPAKGNTK